MLTDQFEIQGISHFLQWWVIEETIQHFVIIKVKREEM
jgi:hypothetical protein